MNNKQQEILFQKIVNLLKKEVIRSNTIIDKVNELEERINELERVGEQK